MAYCNYFLEGIRQINFTETSSDVIRKVLLTSAYQELQQAAAKLTQLIEKLPTSTELNPYAVAQLASYKKKQHDQLSLVRRQMEEIAQEVPSQGINLEEPLQIDAPQFLSEFSSKFRNLSHLASTLSDAPKVIKQLQTQLYVTVLSQLDKVEQEKQLGTLTHSDLQDILKQAIAAYDSGQDASLRSQYKYLVQMVFFELVRRECDKIKPSEHVDYVHYQSFLTALNTKLIDVGTSTIIDNLDQYQNTQGQSIGDLLFEVESKLKTQEDINWHSESKINAAQQKRNLMHQLRFGQEDRREYVRKRQNNMARDLFWARNIRDIELFTKSKDSEVLFQQLAEQRYFKEKNGFKLTEPRVKSPLLPQILPMVNKEKPILNMNTLFQLGNAFERVKQQIKAQNLPQGDRRNPLDKPDDKKKAKLIILQELKACAPIVTQNADGTITIDFFHFNTSDTHLQLILDKILEKGGFNLNVDTMLHYIANTAPELFQKNIHCMPFKGKSLAKIREQIGSSSLDAGTRQAYLKELTTIELEVQQKEKVQIDQLNLSTSDELLLRKLLELKVVSEDPALEEQINLKQEPFTTAFKNIVAGTYEAMLKIEGLSTAVDKAYEQLAQIKQSNSPIIQKAQTVFTSTKERQEKLVRLEAIFQQKPPKITDITNIFLEEYQSMQATLGVEHSNLAQMQQDINAMAEDIVRLIERTQNGQPVLNAEEAQAYFDVIKQIAGQLGQSDMSLFQFKIPHSKVGAIKVQLADKEGRTKEIPVTLKAPLPYSLVKPPGTSEFIFSYGGSRGVIAPFAGFSDASTSSKIKRFFTHSRLLGVGQYGSVKEVESLLSGLNHVVKKGNVPKGEPIYTEEQRKNLRTRPITSREDPLYRIECDVLQALSRAEQASKKAEGQSTQFWVSNASHKPGRPLHQQYKILTERAKGDTLADAANRELNQYTKEDRHYHDPIARHASAQKGLTQFKETLSLSQALIERAQYFESLGFGHNDIKPENFLYKRNLDGSYSVRYIDWATGGFSQQYKGSKSELNEIFAEVFGSDISELTITDSSCSDKQGRFVKKSPAGLWTFGINPKLEMLHGARNGTIPYISPIVLGADRNKHSAAAGVHDSKLDTCLSSGESTLDNYALTAMTFGICSRQAYFELVKGRAVVDYEVPGVLEKDAKEPLGLKIVNVKKFNEFFACDKEVTEGELTSGTAYTDPHAVMFIPSNQREGEPLHLFKHLLDLKRQLLAKNKDPMSQEGTIVQDIDSIVNSVKESIANGKGLTKQQLQEYVTFAQTCIKRFEKLNDPSYQQLLHQTEMFQAVIAKYHPQKTAVKADDLLIREQGDKTLSDLEILCTFANSKEEQQQALTILNSAFDEKQLNDKFIDQNAPYSFLLRECIAKNQSDILMSLISKITQKNAPFIQLVRDQGLLHYAFELGQTDVAVALIAALRKAGANNQAIFRLMMQEYGPAKDQLQTAPHIKWATNCLLIAIRNDNAPQLKTILDLLPEGADHDKAISQALHLGALLGNKDLFNQILTHYNRLNSEHKITAKQLINMTFPPDAMSPYHLFMRDEATVDIIESTGLTRDPILAKEFLLSPANRASYPALIAAAHGNVTGIRRLISLGKEITLSTEEWLKFFKQADEEGKTFLNYALEQKNSAFLNELLSNIKERCGDNAEEVLVYLLSNPHPVNPLQNYLNSEKNEAEQFAMMQKLLDAVCPHFETGQEKLQEARIVALLVNQIWLIEKAQKSQHHGALRSLLHNDALSTPFKRGLFAKLVHDAAEDSTAKTFYQDLLNEISPPGKKVPPIPIGVMRQVYRQQNDTEAFLKTLHEGTIEELQLQIRMKQLEFERTKSALEEQKDSASSLSQQLRDANALLEQQIAEKQLEILQLHERLSVSEANSRPGTPLEKTGERTPTPQLEDEIELLRRELDELKHAQSEPPKSMPKAEVPNKKIARINAVVDNILDNLEQRNKFFQSSRYEKKSNIEKAFKKLTDSDKLCLSNLKLDGKNVKSILQDNADLLDKHSNIKAFLQEIGKSRSIVPIGEVKSFQEFKTAIKDIRSDSDDEQPINFDLK